MKTFGEILRRKRTAKGLAQWQLAEEVGVQQGTVSHWETGKCCPDLLLAVDIADVLDCTLDELVGR